MVYNYYELIDLLGSHKNLVEALTKKKIFKLKKGLYSDEENPKDLEIFVHEHPKAIFTMESALFYLGISLLKPNGYEVITDKDATKIKEENVKQYFIEKELLDIGVMDLEVEGVKIPVYNKSRMLIEVVRYKNKMPFGRYKDAVNYYRDHHEEVDMSLVFEYLKDFPKKDLILRTIMSEVL